MGRVRISALVLAAAIWGPRGLPAADSPQIGEDGLISVLVRPAPSHSPASADESPILARAGEDAPSELRDAEQLRDELAEQALKIFAILDPSWQRYLALPPEVFADGGHPPHERLTLCAARYLSVASDDRFRVLSQREDFRSAHRALMAYIAKLREEATALRLPPPPSEEPSRL